jgi:hypothetical protein
MMLIYSIILNMSGIYPFLILLPDTEGTVGQLT